MLPEDFVYPGTVIQLLGALHRAGWKLSDLLIDRTAAKAGALVGLDATQLEYAVDWITAWQKSRAMTRN